MIGLLKYGLVIMALFSIFSFGQNVSNIVAQKGQGNKVIGSVFNQKETILITFSENNLVLWDVITGLQFAQFESQEGIRAVKILNEDIFAVGYESGNLEIRNSTDAIIESSYQFTGEIRDLVVHDAHKGDLLVGADRLYKLNIISNDTNALLNEQIFKIHCNQNDQTYKVVTVNGEYISLSNDFKLIDKIEIKKRKKGKRNGFVGKGERAFFKNMIPAKFAFSDEGNLLFYTTNDRIHFFDLTKGKLVLSESSYYFDDNFTSLTVSDSFNILLATTRSGYLYRYDIVEREFVDFQKVSHLSTVNHITFSPKTTYFITSSDDFSSILWKTKSYSPIKRFYSRCFVPTSIAFSPSGNRIVSANELGEIHLINRDKNQISFRHDRFSTDPINDIEFYRSDSLLLITGDRRFPYLLNLDNGYKTMITYFAKRNVKRQDKPSREIAHSFTDISFHPSNNYVGIGSSIYNKIHVFNLDSSIRIKDFEKKSMKEKHSGPAYQTAMSPDQNYIAIRGKWMNSLYEIKEGKYYWIRKLDDSLSSIQWTNNNSLLILRNEKLYRKNPAKGDSIELADHVSGFKYHSGLDEIFIIRVSKLYRLKNSTEQFVLDNTTPINDFALSLKKREIVTAGLDGGIRLWKMDEQKHIATFINIDRDKTIVLSPENYYLTDRGGIDGIGFRVDGKIYPPEQFDLKYNRPDLVLKQLGCEDQALIDAYHLAYKKRLKKMGFTEDMLKSDFHLPELKIKNFENLPTITKTDRVEIDINVKDEKYKLDRINVWVNDVAIYGKRGIPLRELNVQKDERTLEINLSKGKNKVQLSALNQAGVESYKETFEIECTAGKEKPTLYVLAIGVSEYKDKRYNLTYASKDALDVCAAFDKNDFYDEIKRKSLTNDGVTIENVRALKEFFADADINDHVILFVAGHGVLNENFDYFFAAHDMDFNAPATRGIPYESIEALLDGIKPLKKLLFMDTCHSGEVDKDDIQIAENESEVEDSDIVFRSVGEAVENKESQLGLHNTSELMKSLFTDLRRGTGATVISSSGGVEFAIESDEWRNGLFTYCLIDGLKNKAADLNKDKIITVSELQTYVRKRVNQLSGGRQTPTSRVQNMELDYRLW
ncbi:caspase family protein [Crocinitomix catalasitica]|nr:caspase family protein [Crocinitomix catalasitica]